MAFRLSNDVVVGADPEELWSIPSEFDDLNGLRDTLFGVVQRAAQLGWFTNSFSCSDLKTPLTSVLNLAKQKEIVDGFLVDCLPNFSDDNIIIRIIMHKDRHHYRMAMFARDEVTDYDFEHTPPNSFSEVSTTSS